VLRGGPDLGAVMQEKERERERERKREKEINKFKKNCDRAKRVKRVKTRERGSASMRT
jgi:hypothetical protein